MSQESYAVPTFPGLYSTVSIGLPNERQDYLSHIYQAVLMNAFLVCLLCKVHRTCLKRVYLCFRSKPFVVRCL